MKPVDWMTPSEVVEELNMRVYAGRVEGSPWRVRFQFENMGAADIFVDGFQYTPRNGIFLTSSVDHFCSAQMSEHLLRIELQKMRDRHFYDFESNLIIHIL